MENWSISEKAQGVFGALAPIIGGLLGIQLYEYLKVMIYGNNNAALGWPLIFGCIAYVVIMTGAGFTLLMDLERKAKHNYQRASDYQMVPLMVLLVGTAIGFVAILHRAVFVIIPA